MRVASTNLYQYPMCLFYCLISHLLIATSFRAHLSVQITLTLVLAYAIPRQPKPVVHVLTLTILFQKHLYIYRQNLFNSVVRAPVVCFARWLCIRRGPDSDVGLNFTDYFVTPIEDTSFVIVSKNIYIAISFWVFLILLKISSYNTLCCIGSKELTFP